MLKNANNIIIFMIFYMKKNEYKRNLSQVSKFIKIYFKYLRVLKNFSKNLSFFYARVYVKIFIKSIFLITKREFIYISWAIFINLFNILRNFCFLNFTNVLYFNIISILNIFLESTNMKNNMKIIYKMTWFLIYSYWIL